MNIAIVTNSYPRSSETFIVRQATELNAFVIGINENKKLFYNLDYSEVVI